MEIPSLTTERLLLRPWRTADLPAFAALNADAEVMRYFPACMSREDSDLLAARILLHFDEHGFGQWIVERREDGAFIGVLGLQKVSFEASFTPAVEIGWRFNAAYWRRGYALEAARAVLAFAFDSLKLAEVVAFTVPANLPSQGLMQRLGMRRDEAGDFEHPRLPEGHALRQHVLYRINREARA
ncbi:GNAT family N-acetyltransferase [Pseudomonas sp. SCB32]|uniref:GNAT family N-acetyltransferase n=1 Tax=Pseudomonas sp. SCB32 TaxID=2653853 RepID=UPI00126496BE|nr:GNAT family N-acetyltransferase [Pseudomonas sp. SCB32]